MITKFTSLIPEFVKRPIRTRLHERWLWRSQAGQDFWVIGEVFDGMREGYFLDIGAHDGVLISNTYLLEKAYRWNGLCIEANPLTFRELIKNRSCTCVNACLNDTEEEVRFLQKGVFGGIVSNETDNPIGDRELEVTVLSRTLEAVLEQHNAPKLIDYLSIDIEGAEELVLKNFPFDRYQFNCITIERPTALLREILRKAEYVLIKEIPGLDCFYLNRSFLERYSQNLIAFFSKKVVCFHMR